MYVQSLSHFTLFDGIQAIFGQKREGNSSNFILLGHKMGSKWAKNGPKWSQMVPKGPHQYSMVILCPTIHDLGPFRPFYIAKKMRNRLKMDPIILLYVLKSL